MARITDGDFEGAGGQVPLGEDSDVLCPQCGVDGVDPGPMLQQLMDLGRAELLECPKCHYNITVKARRR